MLRTYAKRSPLLLTASLLLLALGLGLNLWWTVDDGFNLVWWLLNLLPGLMLLLTGYWVSRARRKRWLWLGLCVLLTLLLTVSVAFINVIRYSFIKAVTPITDIERYAEVRSQFSDADYIQHFPSAIPPEATEAQLYYQRGALQGGMMLQLRLELPEAAWGNVKAEHEPQAQYQVSAENLNSSEFESPVFAPRLWVSDRDRTQFPDTYTLLFLSGLENSLFSYGVAFDQASLDVVYWLEDGS